MLRRAVIQRLKIVASLKGAYQAFLAPANAQKPYATVKIPSVIGDPAIGYAGSQQIEVRIYDDPNSFVGLDAVEGEVLTALNGQVIQDSATGRVFHVEWTPGGGDFVDEEKKMIGRLVRFEAAIVREPGGA